MSESLMKPCPCCGKQESVVIVRASDDENFDHSNDDCYAIICDASNPDGPGGCGCCGGYRLELDDAIAVWNCRTQPEATAPAQDMGAIETQGAAAQPIGEITGISKHDGQATIGLYDLVVGVGDLVYTVPQLESGAALKVAREALEKISTWSFGWDGDCGVRRVAEDAIDAIEAAIASSANALSAGDRVDAERYQALRGALNGYHKLDGEQGVGQFNVSLKIRPGEAWYLHGEELDKHIDAKLAQVAQDKTDYANQLIEDCRKLRDRATAAEAKLEAIRQGVEGLTRWDDNLGMCPIDYGPWIARTEVLSLLQPQHQADESGLPG